MNPTLATLLTTSVTVIAAIMVLVLIFLIPVLLQVRRAAHEAEKLIDSVRLQVAPVRVTYPPKVSTLMPTSLMMLSLKTFALLFVVAK